MPKFPPCPTCGTEHFLKTDPRHGGVDLTDCVKALKTQVEQSLDVSSLNSRLSSLESLVGQKVCFTTFDEKVSELAGAHRSLELRVAALDRNGSATLPEAAATPAPVTQTSEPSGPPAV